MLTCCTLLYNIHTTDQCRKEPTEYTRGIYYNTGYMAYAYSTRHSIRCLRALAFGQCKGNGKGKARYEPQSCVLLPVFAYRYTFRYISISVISPLNVAVLYTTLGLLYIPENIVYIYMCIYIVWYVYQAHCMLCSSNALAIIMYIKPKPTLRTLLYMKMSIIISVYTIKRVHYTIYLYTTISLEANAKGSKAYNSLSFSTMLTVVTIVAHSTITRSLVNFV